MLENKDDTRSDFKLLRDEAAPIKLVSTIVYHRKCENYFHSCVAWKIEFFCTGSSHGT